MAKIRAQEIILEQNEHGKLYLKNSWLQFNLSHSHELALFAFAYDQAVGIDVEFIRKEFIIDDIVKRFFSKREITALFALPKNEQQQAFFNCWARKEAFIKALGVGIFYPLDQFDVAVTRSDGSKELHIHDMKEQANNWHLYALNLAENYAAALVTMGEVRKYDCLLCSGNFSIA